eukprot:7788116-Prorocentrum_lima.AAC.1
MHNTLAAANVPQSALKLVPQIVDTCQICRQLKPPPPRSVATSRLGKAFNHVVQHDLLGLA